MRKRAQIQLSFSVIFSIVIIVATLAIAGYIIVKFLNTDSNTECKLYVQDLQTKINQVWAADGSSSYVFSESVPSAVKQLCFGLLNQTSLGTSEDTIKQNISNYVFPNNNMFYYPRNSCGGNNFYYNLQHIATDGFFCVNIVKGKASVRLSKGSFDVLVKLSK